MTSFLPGDWEGPVTKWISLWKSAGASRETIRLRRGIVWMVARTLRVGLVDVTGDMLVDMAAQREWSVDYRRSVRTTLMQFFNYCIVNGHYPGGNPAESLPKVPESTPRPRPVTDDIWAALLASAGPREQLMARLAGEAGLRRAEVASVHRRDLIEEPDGWSLIVKGKGNKQRVVPITDHLADALRRYQAGWSPQGYLFPGQRNGHISAEHVGVLLSRLMPDGWSMHKLRHRYASRGFAGTGNIRAVQEALGHASVATTQRYTAVSGRDVRRVSEAAR